MQDKHLYEYAVIRIVPKIEREEFINVGLIMFCKRPKFIKARYHVDEEKLRLFTSDIDKESLCTNLHVFDKICSGTKALAASSRFSKDLYLAPSCPSTCALHSAQLS